MATFPTLTPSGRTFTPGEYPHTPFSTISGFQNRVRHSNVMLASQVRLTFVALTEANMLSILSHYQGQLGTYDSFDLPSAVWSGVTAADYELTSYLWRYTEPPTVEDVYCGRYNIELALETVPPDGAIVDGMYRVIVASIIGGEAFTADGLSRSIVIGFSAVGFQVPGLDIAATASLAAGSAAASNGITATVTTSLSAGAAAAANGMSGTVTASFTPGDAVAPIPGANLTVTVSFVGGTASVIGGSDYWSDMSVQLYGWESLAYIEWWGN